MQLNKSKKSIVNDYVEFQTAKCNKLYSLFSHAHHYGVCKMHFALIEIVRQRMHSYNMDASHFYTLIETIYFLTYIIVYLCTMLYHRLFNSILKQLKIIPQIQSIMIHLVKVKFGCIKKAI